MKQFNEKSYYFEMFGTEIVWIIEKDIKKAADYCIDKYHACIDVEWSESMDGFQQYINDKRNKKLYCLIVTRNKNLEVFSHELVHAIQSIAEERQLEYDGEWMAYFYSFLLGKLYK